LSAEHEEQEVRHGDSSAKEEEQSEREEEKDEHIDEEDREKRSAVVPMQAGYAGIDKRRRTTDEVSRSDDMVAGIEEAVPEVFMSPWN
jgi:hypothetical protein